MRDSLTYWEEYISNIDIPDKSLNIIAYRFIDTCLAVLNSHSKRDEYKAFKLFNSIFALYIKYNKEETCLSIFNDVVELIFNDSDINDILINNYNKFDILLQYISSMQNEYFIFKYLANIKTSTLTEKRTEKLKHFLKKEIVILS